MRLSSSSSSLRERGGVWHIEKQVLECFVAYGDLHRGFVRIRCGGYGHEYLLAYSCNKVLLPSCHKSRMLVYELSRSSLSAR